MRPWKVGGVIGDPGILVGFVMGTRTQERAAVVQATPEQEYLAKRHAGRALIDTHSPTRLRAFHTRQPSLCLYSTVERREKSTRAFRGEASFDVW